MMAKSLQEKVDQVDKLASKNKKLRLKLKQFQVKLYTLFHNFLKKQNEDNVKIACKQIQKM